MEPLVSGALTVAVCAMACVSIWLLGRRRERRAPVVAGDAPTARVETIDPLTGLPAGHRVVEQVEQRVVDRSHNRGCGVLVVAPDHLAALNHALGHASGDRVLAAAARRIAAMARADDIVSRWLGPQLVLVASQVPTERDLVLLGERVIEAARGPVELPSGDHHDLTVSVGIAGAFDLDDPPAQDLLRDAALARSRAEHSGGDRARVCSIDDRRQAESRYQLERDLKGAMGRGELQLFYQPVIELESGAIDWIEALIRWRHPVRGLLHPSSFLATAHRLGLGPALSDFVLTRACDQAGTWSTTVGRPIRVSINVQPATLATPELVPAVERSVLAAGIAPDQLALEVDQIVLDRLDHPVAATLERLASLGVAIIVDNARTVTSASWWPVRPVAHKLDRELVATRRRAPEEPSPALVATGIEQGQELALVERSQVRYAQGFWLQRPVPASQLDPVIFDGCVRALAPGNARRQPIPGGG
jgi:diguanylate cyclase (GGDEF)-like protein